MTLSKLLSSLDPCGIFPDCEITALTDRPSAATTGTLCVCIRGARANGHDFAMQAYENGCRAFVVSEPIALPSDAFVYTVPDTRVSLAKLACAFYENPSRQLRVIGITGTKGKTTVASLLSQTLTSAGIPCGYIGTNGVRFGDLTRSLSNTTPDPLTLQSLMREMVDHGIRALALEVSSQAIYQHRTDGIEFEATVFTNLYSDHVGPTEHPSFAHYKKCKHRLFTDYPSRISVFNADDPYTKDMKRGSAAERKITYSIAGKRADYAAENVLPTLAKNGYGVSFFIEGREILLPLLGKFNAANALAVLAVARECFGLSTATVASTLSNVSVTGRTETIPLVGGACAVIDYAHNGESLFKLLSALREYKPTHLICLFGSVGERSHLRRREMGDAAEALCDLAILTSDNPGREDPMAIIEDIAASFVHTPYLAIPDRAQAIQTAVRLVQAGDILVLAGKGHEDYQLIGTERLPFSDREILLQTLKKETASCQFRS
ncbi:MAG: UDP-N-acetylmuramoyl-L-alanyl-D-glutamate--2,6-diaminopimelate ligase [Clostridia bacterium]|nr:UDP-N-acetylmuramoyl-L-alanyl-D-glutamate--2,6-diaminopimelate ligase [Clostridia bacterium]